MRILALLACSTAACAALAGAAVAAEPEGGALSVEHGKGVVMLDLRGSVLGRLSKGSLRVTDLTPTDRYGALVVGRKLTQERQGPRTVLYRGQGLRFRMLGGGYRVVVRGSGIDLSAVGKGAVVLDGDPAFPGDDAGVYSLDGVDCGLEPEVCLPLPTEPERFPLAARVDGRSSGTGAP
jgi:hypothetical protein